jgi:hypothetical protein
MNTVSRILALSTLTLGISGFATVSHAELYYGLGFSQMLDGGEFEEELKNDYKVISAYQGYNAGLDKETIDISHGQGLTATIGFPIKNNLSLETRYSLYKDAVDVKTKISDSDGYGNSYSFDTATKADAHKFGLHGVYRHSLNEYLYVKGAVGATYTMYDGEVKYKLSSKFDGESEYSERTGKIEREKFSGEGSLGLGLRLTSCCNMELEYNTSKENDTASLSVMWRF